MPSRVLAKTLLGQKQMVNAMACTRMYLGGFLSTQGARVALGSEDYFR